VQVPNWTELRLEVASGRLLSPGNRILQTESIPDLDSSEPSVSKRDYVKLVSNSGVAMGTIAPAKSISFPIRLRLRALDLLGTHHARIGGYYIVS
jgi:hypothetical protein